jgi:hypothetical protein
MWFQILEEGFENNTYQAYKAFSTDERPLDISVPKDRSLCFKRKMRSGNDDIGRSDSLTSLV